MKTPIMLALLAVAALPAVAGPPWMSIELPANPFDRATRGAYLVVRTYHHDLSVPYMVSGTAEGLVGGQRRSVRLELSPSGTAGSFVLRKNWPDEGVWVLRLGVDDIELSAAVGVGGDGQVAFVRVPTTRNGAPRQMARVEVETLLRALADGRQVPMLAAAGGGGHGYSRRGAIIGQLAGMGALGGAVVAGLFVTLRKRKTNDDG